MTGNTLEECSYESTLTYFTANMHQQVSREFDFIFINDNDNDTSIVHLLLDSTPILMIMHCHQ